LFNEQRVFDHLLQTFRALVETRARLNIFFKEPLPLWKCFRAFWANTWTFQAISFLQICPSATLLVTASIEMADSTGSIYIYDNSTYEIWTM